MTIFFLHVPKTAGQSFRKAAIEWFGEEHSLLLYGEDSRTTTALANKIYYKESWRSQEERFSALSEVILKKKIRFFGSHASATLLPNFSPEHAAIFLRDPLERIVSHYNYAVKKGYVRTDFNSFIEDPLYRNLQSALLRGRNIESIGFVGLTEKYAQSIDLFNRTFHTNLKIYCENRLGLFSKRVRTVTLPESVKVKVKELNQKDYILYEKVQSLYCQRIEMAGLNGE